MSSASMMTVGETVTPYFFARAPLLALAKQLAPEYRRASPFPHCVVDNFLPPEVLEKVLAEFPTPDGKLWERYRDPLQVKLGSKDEEALGAQTRLLLHEFNSAPFIRFLEELTGIDGLVPDPWFEGGGLHQILPGGLLKVHVDFNKHDVLKLDRRINVLLYLNQNWREEYGGNLELWDTEMTRAEKKIQPLFNRIVIFNTTDFANHGHPDALTCPEGWSRKSLAFYYYSNGRPKTEVRASHTTIFKRRPGENIGWTLAEVGENLLPPILLDTVRKVQQRRSRK